MKVFCWDFNGTLEEGSEIALTEAINEILEDQGEKRRVRTKDVFKFFGSDVSELAKEVSGITIPREKIEELTFTKAEKYIRPVEDAGEILSEVRRRGDMNVIISGSSAPILKRYLDVTGLMPYINGYIGIDTFQIMYSQMGINIRSDDVVTEKTHALVRLASHNDVDRIIMIGDSYQDMKSAYVANVMLYKEGKKRKIRPVLYRPPRRRERLRTGLKERLYDIAWSYLFSTEKASSLKDAMNIGYASRKKGGIHAYIKDHLVSTSTIIGGGIIGAVAGIYYVTGSDYWYLPFLGYPLLLSIGICDRLFKNTAKNYKEE